MPSFTSYALAATMMVASLSFAMPTSPDDSLSVGRRDANETYDEIVKRCEWADSNAGGIPCDYFSIIFDGTWGLLGPIGKENLIISANNFRNDHILDCDLFTPFNPEGWQTYTSPLPWTVDIRPGNACNPEKALGDDYDNLLIKYASLSINVQDSTYCGRINLFDKGVRCLLPQRP